MRRLILLAIALAVVVFAVEGGEYGTTDLVRQHARERKLRAEIADLQRQVDSLGRYRRALLTDPALQERLAREEFGMVRGNKELLYRFADPAPDSSDSAGAGRRAP